MSKGLTGAFLSFLVNFFCELTPLRNCGMKDLVAGNPGLHVNKGCLPFTQTTRVEIFGINTK